MNNSNTVGAILIVTTSESNEKILGDNNITNERVKVKFSGNVITMNINPERDYISTTITKVIKRNISEAQLEFMKSQEAAKYVSKKIAARWKNLTNKQRIITFLKEEFPEGNFKIEFL